MSRARSWSADSRAWSSTSARSSQRSTDASIRAVLQRNNDMLRNWTFGRKVGGAFAVTVFALVVVAITGFRSARSLIANDQLVAHTHLVRREIAALLAFVADAESAGRGYALAGAADFLEPYSNALTSIDKTYRELHELTRDNANQQRRL